MVGFSTGSYSLYLIFEPISVMRYIRLIVISTLPQYLTKWPVVVKMEDCFHAATSIVQLSLDTLGLQL